MRRYHYFTTKEISIIRSYAAERKTGIWIAETMGLTLWSVRGACRRHNIELWGKPGKKPRPIDTSRPRV